MAKQKTQTFKQRVNINAHKISNPDELRALRRSLAKAANQRLVRLENTNSEISEESYTFGAYDIAMQYIEDSGRNRFSESYTYDPIGKDSETIVQRLRNEIDVLQGFLTMKSSTVGGMHEIEKARVEKFESKGIHFATTKEFYDFMNSESFKYLVEHNIFNSETLIEIFQQAADEGTSFQDIQDALNSYRRRAKKPSVKGLRRAIKRKADESK